MPSLNTSHSISLFLQLLAMPPCTDTTSEPDPNCPCTWIKNVTVHPGKAVQDILRAKALGHDPVVIQQEKDAARERKELKEWQKEEEETQNKNTKCIAKELHAQQVSKRTNEEAKIPHWRPKAKSRVHCQLSA